jgi:hypothetical protein
VGVDLAAKREEVRKILTDFLERVEIEKDGSFSFAFGSTRVYVQVGPFGDSASVVSVYAITNHDLPPSPELFEFIATQADAWVFGHLAARIQDAKVFVIFRHSILGDFLQPEELQSSLGAVASTANQIDEQIKTKFGGLLSSEPPVQAAASPPTPGPAAPPAPESNPEVPAPPMAEVPRTEVEPEETDGYL